MYAKHRPRREHLYVGIKGSADFIFTCVFFYTAHTQGCQKCGKSTHGFHLKFHTDFKYDGTTGFFLQRKSLRLNHDQTISNHGRFTGPPKAPSSDHLFNFIRGFREMAKNPRF